MDKVSGRLTVFFEEPFWIGVFERISEGKLSVCKVTFGAEPKDYEVYDFVLRNYCRLKFSPAVATDVKEAGRNPKRVQREVRKQIQNTGIGTKSQQALKLQKEKLRSVWRLLPGIRLIAIISVEVVSLPISYQKEVCL